MSKPLHSLFKSAVVATLGVLALSLVPNAYAQFGGSHVHCLNCATESTAIQILSAVNQARTAIVGAIRGSTEAQTAATNESAKIVADANTKTAAEMEKVRTAIKAEPLDPCGVTAAARGGSAVATNRPAGGGRGGGGAANSPTAGATTDMFTAV